MFRLLATALASLLVLVACDGGGTPTNTTTTTSAPALQLTGAVTSYRFDPIFQGSSVGTISYIVTNQSSRAVSGCFVEVKWLDRTGLQVSFSFAATNASIPQGASTFTNQHSLDVAQANRITNSRVEYSNCR